jgi:hypothetical protein
MRDDVAVQSARVQVPHILEAPLPTPLALEAQIRDALNLENVSLIRWAVVDRTPTHLMVECHYQATTVGVQ